MVDSLDQQFDLLRRQERRQLLLELLERERNESLELEELSVSSYHVHIPILQRHDVVEWDSDDRILRRGTRFDELRPLLTYLRENDIDRPPTD